ncbi:hypothetical protein D2V17_09155 [Aurantiacibacter xanthus]|uniref:Response receiver domain-containing protein n=1 Tax=Aurantiacibacter xanthus TaxID=1784712 RepID=A0A3A1P811_9SPHN|nr:hypothetical protein [Aurantiacibacter xanthus]RIV86955.1 hypothetical protein D2V17_09155 [Aurantiacibacter xanthus]
MTDKEIIAAAGIKSALIVDDGYDLVPRASELADVDWDIFFDDAIGDALERLEAVFPGFDPDERADLRGDDAFIQALWEHRGVLDDLVRDLFADYVAKSLRDIKALGEIEEILTDLGIAFTKAGRDFVKAAEQVDLIIIDLFLGAAQSDEDRQTTVAGLKKVIDGRDAPPAVVLMSQISLTEEAPGLRDEVELHASGFRSIQKKVIKKGARMRRIIATLATHREDSLLLAEFTNKWKTGASDAVERAGRELRRIDIDDLHHIKSLLLSAEGLLPSSYMVSVLDRVLQYEIEADKEILSGAEALDKISDKPAPLTIAKGKDSFRLIERTVFANPERRKRDNGSVWPLTFGDILMSRLQGSVSKASIFKGDPNRVFFVASPECDLLRGKNLHAALLIGGTLEPLAMTEPLFGEDKTTPIITRGKKRYQIRWDFGFPATITLQRAKNHLASDGSAKIAETLRDVSALNLRQQYLDHIGRVGMMALPPRTFNITVQCAYPTKNGDLVVIKIGSKSDLTGVMHIDQRTKTARIAFDQTQEDDFADAILGIDLGDVATNSRSEIEALQQQTQLQQLFRTGFQNLKYPLKPSQVAQLIAPSRSVGNDASQKNKPIGKLFDGESSHPSASVLQNSGFAFTLLSEHD